MATATEAPATIPAEGPTQHVPNQILDRLEALIQSADAAGAYTREERIAALHRLREPFAPQEVRYRPQPWCKKCTGQKSWPKVCEHHHEIKCQRCGGQKVTDAHICLRYIGHAEATNRLLNVDPFWNWEPLALDQVGLPQYDGNRGMWIRLTVCGVSRIGYGDATGKDGANAVKEIIGDAIRNAGMRFGMALNLWTSSELEILEPGVPLAPELAAELGRATDSPTTPAAAQQRTGDQADFDRIVGQLPRSWENVTALKQIKADAEKHAVFDQQVQGPDGTWQPMRTLVTVQIAALEQAAEDRNNERSAA
ncbi:hypothetical protein [Streptomyces sp. NPDC047981]|uniref:hypothetical protein n=1 Tax=Streptomyces sp. NPDC047981 TaxID=3154610 RepID=UPI003421BC15